MATNVSNEILDRFIGSVIGMAAGDAYGTTYEFTPRHGINPQELSKYNYMGGGPFRLMRGMFTDDTSLSLVQAESLLDFYSKETIEKNKIVNQRLEKMYNFEYKMDPVDENNTCLKGRDIQDRSLRWYNEGHFSANGRCFDIGRTTLNHLLKNQKIQSEFSPRSDFSDNASGNGALMRLTTVPLYFYGVYLRKLNEVGDVPEIQFLLHRVIEESGMSAITTHPSLICIDANRYMAALLIGCLQNATKEEILSPFFVPKGLPKTYWEQYPLRKEVSEIIGNCKYKKADAKDIVNSGYSAKAFEAALWGFYHTDNFMDGLMKLVALGDDSDTIGAIYGQLAGCYYKISGISLTLFNNCVYSKLMTLMSKELLRAPLRPNENSWSYTQVMRLFAVLENSYSDIIRRASPCPKQFKSLNEFDDAVNDMKNCFLNEKAEIIKNALSASEKEVKEFESVSDSLLQDFMKRCNQHDRDPLKLRLGRSQK